jgi:uncharacterized protein
MILFNSLLSKRAALVKVARTGVSMAALCLVGGLAFAQPLQPIPQLKTRVTDLTGTLDAAANQAITAKLAQIEQTKGSQVAVLIVASTQPEAIEQYAQRVTDQWKLGRGKVDGKSVDDGVLLLIAKDDRKIRVAVGKGLEGAIPDIYAKRIARDTISPKFKLGDFSGGVTAGVDEIGKLIAGEALPEPWHAPDPIDGGSDGSTAPNSGNGSLADLLPVLIFLLVGAFILTAMLGKFLGSTASGLGGGFIAAALAGSPIIGGVVGLGLFLLMLMFGGSAARGVRQVGRHTYGSGPVVFPGGFGGAGSWGGGGSSSGGFSGGGGDFGGGGASGDW